MRQPDLEEVARQLVRPGLGILAADESLPNMKKRSEAIGLQSTEELRRAYREMLFTSPGIEEYISGVILYEESTGHRVEDGGSFIELLSARGILPGVKVGTGNKDLPRFPGEQYTEGLDGLPDRLPAFKSQGLTFTKWRGVIAIGPGLPTLYAIDVNAQLLARMAALSQEAGLVPIVEPEVLMEGDHGFEECFDATHRTLRALVDQLHQHRVRLEALVVKTNMVMPGSGSSLTYAPDDVADATIDCFRQVLPPAVPGVAFLSGGQSEREATANLNAMNERPDLPWTLTFSYGRALLESALRSWAGSAQNVEAAQSRFLTRARNNAAASVGEYDASLDPVEP